MKSTEPKFDTFATVNARNGLGQSCADTLTVDDRHSRGSCLPILHPPHVDKHPKRGVGMRAASTGPVMVVDGGIWRVTGGQPAPLAPRFAFVYTSSGTVRNL